MPNVTNFTGEFETGRVTVGLTAVQLPDVRCKNVALRTPVGGNVTVGDSAAVTITTGITILAGTALPTLIPVDNLSQIWAVASVAGHAVEFLVMR